jgi:uncharacterized membrane protein
MKVLNLFFKRQTAAPMLALTFASAISVGVVFARIVWTGNLNYGCLIWNLFLAWLPLVFALLASDHYKDGARQTLRFAGFALAWLLFFPNAPYIFTDLIHLTTRFYMHFWVDLVLILMCAVTGLVLGFLSLYLMQSVVARMFGRVASWLFIAVATGLGSFGIFLGRFLRFNSWDVLTKPTKLYHDVGMWTTHPAYYPASFAFPALFAAFLFIAYLMLYALTHLSPAHHVAAPHTAKAIGTV